MDTTISTVRGVGTLIALAGLVFALNQSNKSALTSIIVAGALLAHAENLARLERKDVED